MFIRVQNLKRNDDGVVVSGSASVTESVYDADAKGGHCRQKIVLSLGKVIWISEDKKAAAYLIARTVESSSITLTQTRSMKFPWTMNDWQDPGGHRRKGSIPPLEMPIFFSLLSTGLGCSIAYEKLSLMKESWRG